LASSVSEDIPGGLSSISIGDAAGLEQILWFGAGTDTGSDRFRMPPLPPPGGFDVRFGSGRFVELREPGTRVDLPILLSGAAYPIRIAWSGGDGSSSLNAGGRVIPLAGSGEAAVTRPDAPLVVRLSVPTAGAHIPVEFALRGNFPNPFNPSTLIEYALPAESRVKLTVFDLLGREVAVIADGVEGAGHRRAEWHAGQAAGGVYVYRLEATAVGRPGVRFTATGKMVLIR
jgi:hypothetical protein